MVDWQDRDVWLAEHRCRGQAVDGVSVADDPGVDIPREQAVDDASGEGLVQLELHAAVRSLVSRQDSRKGREHRRADKADVQAAGLAGSNAARLVDVIRDTVKGSTGPLQKRRACGGQANRTRGTGQKLAADGSLELTNGLRQRWLGHVQAGGRATEVQLFSDGHEVPQMAQLNIHMPGILMQTNKILDVSASRPTLRVVHLAIRPLRDAFDATAFRALNEEWIAQHFTIEEQDRRQLDDPVAAYIDPGGEILIAVLAGQPVGCVALMPDGTGAYELSKMAISPELRGQGAGRTLLTAAIDHARALGAHSLFLGSSRKLANAVHLY